MTQDSNLRQRVAKRKQKIRAMIAKGETILADLDATDHSCHQESLWALGLAKHLLLPTRVSAQWQRANLGCWKM